MNITKGKQSRAQKVVIYGPEGIGKTTLASQLPDPLFLDLEDGSATMDVRRVSDIQTWQQLGEVLVELIHDPSICKTVVIDTADKAEALATEAICEEKKISSIEDPGYGKGYTYLAERMASLISTLGLLVKKGVNVVIIAHAAMRKFEQPDEMGAYDRWELKLQKKVAPLLKEWADMVLFLNYKTKVIKSEKSGSTKAKGGERVIYASHHACWDAKSRHGLPDEFPMSYDIIKPIFEEASNGDNDPKDNL